MARGIRTTLATLALVAALALPAWFGIAAIGTKSGWWGWQLGFVTMTLNWGPMLIIGAGVLAVITLVLGLIRSPRIPPTLLSIFALLIVFLIFGRLGHMGTVARTLPPIHDVQTDWSDPVYFSDAIMTERNKTDGVNPVLDDPKIPLGAEARWPKMGGRRVAEVQAEKYQPLQTVIKSVPPEKMYTAAFIVLSEMGIEIVTTDEENFRLEGTYTSQWYGFKDDIAVRIRPKGEEGSEIDVRSTSRVGLSDLGANAERVHAFLEGLDTKLDELN